MIEKEDGDWRQQVLSINEALQFLTRKKENSKKALKTWKHQSRKIALLSSLFDNPVPDKNSDGTERVHIMTKAESRMAQEMALKIASTVDDLADEKTKKQHR